MEQLHVEPSSRPGPYPAPALEKGLEIIELLAAAQKPLSTRVIAESLGRSKGEIFRMLFVLVERGYLNRDPATEELTLSNRLFELGMRTPRTRQLVEVAAPAMERLSAKTAQSAHLVVLNEGAVLAEGSPEQVRADPAVAAAYLSAYLFASPLSRYPRFVYGAGAVIAALGVLSVVANFAIGR